MGFLFAAGVQANILEGAASITTSSESSLFEKWRLVDREPGSIFRFASAGANDRIDIDLSRDFNGGFEGAFDNGVPEKWTDASNGTGALEEETAEVHTGGSTKALRLNGGGSGNEAVAKVQIKVLSGWAMTLQGYLRGDGTDAATMRAKILETGQYLQSDGTLSSSEVDFGSESGSAYVEQNASFTVPGFSSTQRHSVTLEIELRNDGDGLAYADDIALWPHWNFVSLHHHNLGANIAPTVSSDAAADFSGATTRINSSTTGLKTFDVRRGKFWGRVSALVTARHLRMQYAGTNFEPIENGELVVTQIRTLQRKPQWGFPTRLDRPQVEAPDRLGRGRVLNLTGQESERVAFQFSVSSKAERDEMKNELVVRSGQGRDPVIVVPDDTEADVIYGRIGRAFEFTTEPVGTFGYGLEVLEETFPVRVG